MLLTALLGAMLPACAAHTAPVAGEPSERDFTLAAVDTATGLRLEGELRGPLLGFGQGLALTAWVRADGWIRAELRYELEGRRAEEVVVWTPDAAFIVDRRTGRLTLLGDQPGTIEAAGAAFRVEHALWLAFGRQAPSSAAAGSWERRRGEWRGRLGNVAARGRPRRSGTAMGWTELAWRAAGAGPVRAVTAELRRPAATPWGDVPGELVLDGAGLAAKATLRWRVQSVPAPGDSLFDPLWRP